MYFSQGGPSLVQQPAAYGFQPQLLPGMRPGVSPNFMMHTHSRRQVQPKNSARRAGNPQHQLMQRNANNHGYSYISDGRNEPSTLMSNDLDQCKHLPRLWLVADPEHQRVNALSMTKPIQTNKVQGLWNKPPTPSQDSQQGQQNAFVGGSSSNSSLCVGDVDPSVSEGHLYDILNQVVPIVSVRIKLSVKTLNRNGIENML
ncbi:hypothetical protein MKW98_023145 [Papaver atlanticum]|uniref:Uncharacterized protein n=1 Tax=Papaver atlanticum TaxID=357466 RepID=A0AAD4T7S4_9MAGN|nr:hypothetical protein MKW98_023145 [Papaver atlanticum]